MKRFFAAVLAACLLLLLPACGTDPPEEPMAVPEPSPAQEAAETAQPEPLPVPELEPEPEPTPEELAAAEIENLLASLSLEEKVGQLFFVRCPAENAAEDVGTYHLGGYILFGRDMKDSAGSWLTREQLQANIQSYQDAAKIPLLIGVDEEGGSVVRISANPNLAPEGKFKSPQYLWKQGEDHTRIFADDARNKSELLLSLGVNVNLAPVCDVTTDSSAFIYDRTLGQDAVTTAYYVATVVNTMQEVGIGSVLKHFPGYGNNVDTHTGIALDDRPYEQFFNEDFDPFRAGISEGINEAGQQTAAVLMSHNIVTCMDPDLPVSLSPEVHRTLREELHFEGPVMTDDLAMDAVAAYSEGGAVAVMAIEAGNDLIITTDYRSQIPKVIEAVQSGTLPEETIDAACRRVLQWKQALGLI